MLKNKQIFTKFFVIQILLLLIMSTNNVAIAKNNIPVSQKIWQGLASSDIDLFKKVINLFPCLSANTHCVLST